MDINNKSIFFEYGTYASDKWLRPDLGVLIGLSPLDIADINRLLTKTMLSLVPWNDKYADQMDHYPNEINSLDDIKALVKRLAVDEDRSITWPGYPDPKGRIIK